MTTSSSLKSPGDFSSNEEWRAYVRRVVGAPDVNYVLARGRLTLFECFYENRGYPFSETFKNELLSIEPLAEPERTSKLEKLNARVLADVTQLLFTAAPSESRHGTVISPTTPVEVIDDLVAHLRKRNSYFGLWQRYMGTSPELGLTQSWEDFAEGELGGPGDDLDFAIRMADLGRLLLLYRDGGQALPARSVFQISLLHNLRGKERSLQARVLVQQLLEGLARCTSV